MKRNKRLTAVLLLVLAMILLLPVTAIAAESFDSTHDVSLTIAYQDGNTPLIGAEFEIYLAATVDESGNLTPTEVFAGYHVVFPTRSDAWGALASTLEGYVLRDQIAPTDSGKTDAQGLLTFPNTQNSLPQGLYLVIGQRSTQNGSIYEPMPFLVMLPSLNEESGEWIYDVTAIPKNDSNPIPEQPATITRKVLKVWADEGYEKDRPAEVIVQLLRDREVYDTVTLNADNGWNYTWTGLDSNYKWTVVEGELEDYTVTVTPEGITFVVTNTYDASDNPPPTEPENPTGPTLPQTGQLWWPVPVLIAAGLLFVVIGLLRRRGSEYED